MDLVGFEPTTFSMPLRRAPNCAIGPEKYGSGPGGIRTLDLLSAIEARSQLRYRPKLRARLYPIGADVSSKGKVCVHTKFVTGFAQAAVLGGESCAEDGARSSGLTPVRVHESDEREVTNEGSDRSGYT